MKKNLAKRIVLGLLTGAVLMSSSVAWAADYTVYRTGGAGSFGVGYSNSDDSDETLNPGGVESAATNSIVIGANSVISGSSSIGLGLAVKVTTDHSVAIGSNASVTGLNGVAIGAGAKVEGGLGVALGKDSIASGNVVSVGVADDPETPTDEGIYRKIVNVKDGTSAHDAATVGQMEAITGLGYESIKNTNGLTYINSQGITLTGAVIALDKQVKANADAIANISGAGGNYVEKETIEGGTQTNISENFVVTNTTVSGGSGTTTSVTINSSDPNNPIVMDNEGITVGTNSTRMDGTGFYVWADGNNNTNSPHDPADAIAAITDDGTIKGVNGTFSGNVTAANLYTKTDLYNKTEMDTELALKANASDVYTKTETDNKNSAAVSVRLLTSVRKRRRTTPAVAKAP